MKLQPIVIKSEIEIRCKHAADWPPAHASLEETPLALRQAGDITETKFQQLQTWEKVCGLKTMQEDKCSTCPLALTMNSTGQWVPLVGGDKAVVSPVPPFAKAAQGRRR